jgi:High potential iron-sulfur protein
MNISNRRTFMLKLAASSAVLVATGARGQAAGPALEESDPQATALGYKQDSAKVDGKKYPKHEASQTCANCQLFQGKATDAAGACPLFAGKQVAAKGWCSAWAKKAA